jgi:hypothetical protein
MRRLRPIDLPLVCGGLVDGLGQMSTLGSPRRGHFDVAAYDHRLQNGGVVRQGFGGF